MNKRMEDDLDRLEQETRKNAIKRVADLLQRPDQLERVEQFKRQHSRKKAAVDAHLKQAVQSQLDGVKTGLSQLRSCLEDIKVVKTSLQEIHSIYDSVAGLKEKLADLAKESAKHNQLATSMESLNHVSNVPELVRKTDDLIADGKLLLAHRHLSDLESSRDQLMVELHKQDQQNENDAKMLHGYFAEVQKLSEKLSKQLWMIMSRTLITVRKEPAVIVTALRIVEREERADAAWKVRSEQTGYNPPDRPKKWRSKVLNILSDTVEQKLEGSQLEDRTEHKMWLVRHLEIIRRNTIEDLKVIKSLCEPCFPPVFDIVKTYVKLYHTAISQHLLRLIEARLEGNEIISLLNWVTLYYGPELMGHRGLDIHEVQLGPLLAPDVVEDLQSTYTKTLQRNVAEWMANAMNTDKKDWYLDREPETDGKGFFITQLPVLLFQIIEQNMQVAQLLGPDVAPKVLDLCLNELSAFANLYMDKLAAFKDGHLKDRSQPRCYIQYMIGNINNCDTLSESTKQLKIKYSEEPGQVKFEQDDRYSSIQSQFAKLAEQGRLYLKEEVFLDLGQFINNVLTRQWLESETDIDTVCVTTEDYCQDFVHLRPHHFALLMQTIQEQIIVSYLRQLLSPSRKISFKNPDERRDAGEKICKESEQISKAFKHLAPLLEPSRDLEKVLPATAEFLKMLDTSLISLELGKFVSDFPDVRQDQLVNLLQLRGDINKSDVQQYVNDALGPIPSATVRKGIMSRV